MMDVVFISYNEPNSEENWQHLLSLVPNAIRVHGIKGIPQAHIEASNQITTSHFFTVDGDNIVNEDFDWEKIIDFQNNDQRIHVWRCINIVNGLRYGYGGIKLWPSSHVKNIKDYSVDFTTSVANAGFKVQNKIASITAFNTDPYNAWRSGYREAVKLSSSIIKNGDIRSINRLKIWTSVGLDVDYGIYTILGARMGACYGMTFKDDEKELSNINDFDWCRQLFNTISNDDPLIQTEYQSKILKDKFNFDTVLFSIDESKLIKETIYEI